MNPRGLAAALLLSAGPVWADGPQAASVRGPFGIKAIGEGGSNALPNGEAEDYLQNNPRVGPDKPTDHRPRPEPERRPEAKPQPHSRDHAHPRIPTNEERRARLPGPRPPVAAVGEESRPSPRPQESPRKPEQGDAKAGARDQRYSLWEGIAAPLELPSDKIGDVPEEQARSMVNGEYERRMLGAQAIAMGERDLGSAALASNEIPYGGKDRGLPPAEMFVAIELKAGQDELRDAVAGLQSVAGFRPDTRFAPMPSERAGARGRMVVRGWLPPSKIGSAMQSPAVGRLELEPPRGSAPGGSSARLMVGVRVPREGSAAEAFDRVLKDLGRRAGFRWTRTIGYQPVPRSDELALVVIGELPLREIGRLMQHPSIVKVAPAPPEPEAPLVASPTPAEPVPTPVVAGVVAVPAPAKPAAPQAAAAGATAAVGEVKGFLGFVREKAPLLIVATLLLIGVSLFGSLRRAGKFFVPYRR